MAKNHLRYIYKGTVYIRPLIVVHCMYSYPYLKCFLPFTICPKLPSELQRAVYSQVIMQTKIGVASKIVALMRAHHLNFPCQFWIHHCCMYIYNAFLSCRPAHFLPHHYSVITCHPGPSGSTVHHSGYQYHHASTVSAYRHKSAPNLVAREPSYPCT